MSSAPLGSNEQASARSQRFLMEYGKAAAHRVWDRMLRHHHHPDCIPELVADEMTVFRILVDGQAITEPDRTTVLDFVEATIVREGKQLALLFAIQDGGTA